MRDALEVKTAVLQTFDGETIEVQGGAYLSPDACLSTGAELDRLREKTAQQHLRGNQLAGLIVTASLVGLAVGLWWGRGNDVE